MQPTSHGRKYRFVVDDLISNFEIWFRVFFKDITEAEEGSKQHQFPLKIEWPSRKGFGFDDDDSDERPDSGVGESVSDSIVRNISSHV